MERDALSNFHKTDFLIDSNVTRDSEWTLVSPSDASDVIDVRNTSGTTPSSGPLSPNIGRVIDDQLLATSGSYIGEIGSPWTVYNNSSDKVEGLIFDRIGQERYIKMEEGIGNFENKFGITSQEFLDKRKIDQSYDTLEFNEWAKLLSTIEYVKARSET